MAKGKSAPYSLGVNEKELLEILESFQQEFSELNKENGRKMTRLEYYGIVETKKSEIPGLFVTVQQSADGKTSYHLYFQSPQNEIGTVDENGNINIKEAWRDKLSLEDIERCIGNKKQEGLKGISEEKEPHEMTQRLRESKKEEPTEEQEDDKKEEQIQSDIGGQENLEISYYRQITDINFGEQIGMNLNGYQEIGLAFSETKNAFILVGKKDGVFQQVDGFKLAQPTIKKVISIDEQGENVETEVPHALMETNNPDKELSITIGQYGYIEVGTIDRLPCNKRVKRHVGEVGEGDEGRTDAVVNDAIMSSGEEGLDDWAKGKKEQGLGTRESANVPEEISHGNSRDYILGTNVTWGELASKCGFRGKGAIGKAQRTFEAYKVGNSDKTNAQLVDEIVLNMEEQSRGSLNYN